MTEEELRTKRYEQLKEKVTKKRAWLFRETGMSSADENFYMCLLRHNEIEELPENYSYLLPIEDLIQKIEKDTDGFYYIKDSHILTYQKHSNFNLIAHRLLNVINQRNLKIDAHWEDSAHIAKYRFDYWDHAHG